MSKIKIMSFNLRTQAACDGINQFINRENFIAEKLGELKPDVIGFQEVQPLMHDWLVGALDDYYVVGGGRGNTYGDEAVSVAFRKTEFKLYDCETFWLSPTPNNPGSTYGGDQSSCPRICTWLTLKPNGGAPFRFYNVHTDHVGVFARVLEANQVLAKISENNSKMPMKTFVTGDFNDTPDSLCIKSMLGSREVPLIDLSADSGLTYHAFGKELDKNCKIDYIFADKGTECLAFNVYKDSRGELYLSDHYPIMAEIEI